MRDYSLDVTRKAVAEGRRVLKEYDPDVFKHIPPAIAAKLNMSSGTNCILGIVFGSYIKGIQILPRKLGREINFIACGFNDGWLATGSVFGRTLIRYEDLDIAWGEVLKEELK